MSRENSSSIWTNRIKKGLGFVVKLAIAGGIVAVLIGRDTEGIKKGFETFNYIWIIPAVLLYFAHMFICALRWHTLTKVLNIALSCKEAISLTMQSYFFSLVVPGGAIGGDLVKIGVLSSRSSKGTKVEGAFSILVDRIVGMIALFLLVIVVTIPAIPTLMNVKLTGIELNEHLKIFGIAMLFVISFAGLFSSGAIFIHNKLEAIKPIGFLMHKVDSLTKGMLKRMTSATDIYKKQWIVLLKTVVISIPFVHLMSVAVFYCLTMGLNVDGATILTITAAVIIGNVVGLIPIFPSGIGGRDVAVVTILVAGGMVEGEAKTVQLIYTALMIFCNLVSGLFFIFDPGKQATGVSHR